MKRSIRQEAYAIERKEHHDEYVKKARIDSTYRTNSLGEVRRMYMFLNGNGKGFEKFVKPLKTEKFMVVVNGIVRWYFDKDELWKHLNNYFKKRLDAMRINSIDELSFRVMQHF